MTTPDLALNTPLAQAKHYRESDDCSGLESFMELDFIDSLRLMVALTFVN